MPKCKYDQEYTEDERAAFEWLSNTLRKIIAKGPTHVSYHHAVALDRAVQKLDQHAAELHGAAHALESRLLIYAATQMAIMPVGDA